MILVLQAFRLRILKATPHNLISRIYSASHNCVTSSGRCFKINQFIMNCETSTLAGQRYNCITFYQNCEIFLTAFLMQLSPDGTAEFERLWPRFITFSTSSIPSPFPLPPSTLSSSPITLNTHPKASNVNLLP